jgi:hypothetical protein
MVLSPKERRNLVRLLKEIGFHAEKMELS